MVDKEKDPVILSVDELGIGITPSKESGRTAEKSSKKERAKGQLASGFGFSAEELDRQIDFIKIDRIVTKEMKDKGPNAFRIEHSDANMVEVLKSIGEVFITAILFYKGLQEYRDKLSEEFIAPFTPDEQAFLRKMKEELDDYILIQENYISQLLELLGYEDLNAFIDDAIKCMEADVIVAPKPNREISFSAEEQDQSLLYQISQRLSGIVKNMGIMPQTKTENISVPAHKKDERLFKFARISNIDYKSRIAIYLANKLQKKYPSDINDKVAIFLEETQKNFENMGALPITVAEKGVSYKNMMMYYARSTLPQHADRREQCLQAKTTLFCVQNEYDPNTYIFSGILTRLNLLFLDIAKRIDDEWTDSSGRKLSVSVESLRQASAKITEQKNQAERRYVLLSMSSLADNDPNQARSGEIYINENTREYVVLDLTGKPQKGKLPEVFRKAIEFENNGKKMGSLEYEIDLTRLSERLKDKELVTSVLAFTSMKGYTIDDSAAIRSPKSVHRLSGVIGTVETVAREAAEKIKSTADALFNLRSNDVPFTDYACTALHTIETFHEIAKEHKDDPKFDNSRFKDLKFIYKRSDGRHEKKYEGRIPKSFRDGDSAEIYRKEELIFTAENLDAGVGVTVHSDEDRDIDLAVLVMVESLAKTGQKEVCISLDLSAPGADELVMKYVKAILAYKAIPVLLDGEKELSVEETKVKLEGMAKQISERGDNRYKNVAEQYDEQVKMIKHRQNEDALFLRKLEEHMERIEKYRRIFEEKLKATPSVESSEKYVPPLMQDPNSINSLLTMAGVVARLGEMVLVDRNLTADEFLNKIIECVQKVSGYRQGKFSEKDLANIKKDLRKTLDILIAKHQGLPPQFIAATIFNLAAKKLESDAWLSKEDIRPTKKQVDEVFIAAFNDFLRKVQTSASAELIMKDPNPHTAEDLNITQILIRLAEITCAHKNMAPDIFVDKIVALTLALSGDAEQGVVEDKEKILRKALQKEVDQYFETAHEERVSIKEFVTNLKEVISTTLAETDRVVDVHPIEEELVDVNSEEENLALERSDQEIHLSDVASLSQVVPENHSNKKPEIALNDKAADGGLLLASERLAEDKVGEPNLSKSLFSAQEDFSARVGILYDKRTDIERERSFERALGAYALFHEAIKQKRFDLARSLMSDVALLIEDAEVILKADAAKHSVKERAYVREIYNSLLRKAFNELKLDTTSDDVSTIGNENSLDSFSKQILIRDLKQKKEIAELLTEIDNSSAEEFQRDSFDLEPKEKPVSKECSLTQEDRDYLAYLDDLTFIEALDSLLLQRVNLPIANDTVIMQDPNTGESLNELQILVRLVTMALVDKTMTEDDFLERIITFAFVSPKLASNVSLTPQKTEELKKELRSKFQGKEIDPEHIDELVSKLFKIARHEHSKGHTAEEIAGQHRDLYAPVKETMISSHQDDDGEGETRAPAMSHTH